MLVRVRPDLMAVEDTFLYEVPSTLEGRVALGSMVRVEMNGRRVNGWVTELDVEGVETRKYRPLINIRSVGPPESVLSLAKWASWRWAGPESAFLDAASPDTMVTGFDPVTQQTRLDGSGVRVTGSNPVSEPELIELAPHQPRSEILLRAAKSGNVLILFPTFEEVKRAQSVLRDSGISSLRYPDDWARIRANGGVVVATRRGAWAPLVNIDCVAVFDAHDHRYVEERAPTWSAVDVAVERARRHNASAILVSPCFTTVQSFGRIVSQASRDAVRSGWPEAEIVDMRDQDPRKGLWSEELTKLLRSDARIVCILNRKGRAQLLICDACKNVAACENCGAVVHEIGDLLVCQRCETSRPRVCQACHSQSLKRRRLGIDRAKDELEALIGEEVSEISKEGTDAQSRRVTIGTEAALFRVSGRVDVVAFIDFDQEILAPIVGASERAMSLCARAARMVPPRHKGGVLLFQTRNPDHEVLDAVKFGDPNRVRAAEDSRRKLLVLPPYSAVAIVEGNGAPAYVEQMTGEVEVIGPRDGRFLVRCSDHTALCDLLSRCERGSGKIRVVVDPLWY